jgi:hypothetical protein
MPIPVACGRGEPALRALIGSTRRGLARNRNLAFPRTGNLVASAPCVDTPVCALVVVAFEAEGWQGAGAGVGP